MEWVPVNEEIKFTDGSTGRRRGKTLRFTAQEMEGLRGVLGDIKEDVWRGFLGLLLPVCQAEAALLAHGNDPREIDEAKDAILSACNGAKRQLGKLLSGNVPRPPNIVFGYDGLGEEKEASWGPWARVIKEAEKALPVLTQIIENLHTVPSMTPKRPRRRGRDRIDEISDGFVEQVALLFLNVLDRDPSIDNRNAESPLIDVLRIVLKGIGEALREVRQESPELPWKAPRRRAEAALKSLASEVKAFRQSRATE